MSLSILGLGLHSPAGLTASDHVFFLRAEGPPPAPSPFLAHDGKRIDVRCCAWIGGFEDAAARLHALVAPAIAEALASVTADPGAATPLFLVTPAPRAGLGEDALARLAEEVGRTARGRVTERFSGAAGAFLALSRVAELVEVGAIDAALVVGVDTLLDLDTLGERAARPANPWQKEDPAPGEGAAALLVASPARASRWGARRLGELVTCAHARGPATDEDDDPQDARALTALLARLPEGAPIRAVFGQGRVGHLRSREWEWSAARCADRFDPSLYDPCIEVETGQLGAAAGVANLAFACAAFRHGVAPRAAGAPVPFLCWAMSRDGTRGIALGSATPPEADALAPLLDRAHAKHVERDPFSLPESPAEDTALDGEAWGHEAALEPGFAPAAANDLSPALPALPHAPPPLRLVALDADRRAPISRERFHDSVVEHAFTLLGVLGRARFDAPWTRLPEIEARLLRQLDAVVAAGPRALHAVASCWEQRADVPWAAFAGALAAAAFTGPDAIDLIRHHLHALPSEGAEHVVAMVEALSLSEHPDLARLARALLDAPVPPARAVGIQLAATRGELAIEAIAGAIEDESELVASAAIRASELLPPPQWPLVVEPLRDRCWAGAPAVAWAAARVLLVRRDERVARDLAGSLGARVGARVAELFALVGVARDWPVIESLLRRHRVTPQTIEAVGRFGGAGAAPWLVQRLGSVEIAGAARAALEVMLGPLVDEGEAEDAGAWRRAIAARRLDPGLCYRRGEPWSPAVVAAEVAGGGLPRHAVERRLDELRARAHLSDPVDLSHWWSSARPRLERCLDRLDRTTVRM